MTKKRIFITGASGCIGHYVVEQLIEKTDHELFLIVRDSKKLKVNCNARPGVTILQSDLRSVGQYSDLLTTIDVAILMATAWGEGEAYEINLHNTLELIQLFNPEKIEQILYFSTASLLGRQNELLKEAEDYGTEYIRSKYLCYQELRKSAVTKSSTLQAIAPKITALFPTLVIGGDQDKPYSHITAGLQNFFRQAELIRWFRADASCHFMHSYDIAQIVVYLVDHPAKDDPRFEKDESGIIQLVLGNASVNITEIAEDLGAFLGKKTYLRIPLNFWFAHIFIKILNIPIQDWDRFCMDYRHFTYSNPISPSTFNLTVRYPTVTDIFKAYREG